MAELKPALPVVREYRAVLHAAHVVCARSAPREGLGFSVAGLKPALPAVREHRAILHAAHVVCAPGAPLSGRAWDAWSRCLDRVTVQASFLAQAISAEDSLHLGSQGGHSMLYLSHNEQQRSKQSRTPALRAAHCRTAIGRRSTRRYTSSSTLTMKSAS